MKNYSTKLFFVTLLFNFSLATLIALTANLCIRSLNLISQKALSHSLTTSEMILKLERELNGEKIKRKRKEKKTKISFTRLFGSWGEFEGDA